MIGKEKDNQTGADVTPTVVSTDVSKSASMISVGVLGELPGCSAVNKVESLGLR